MLLTRSPLSRNVLHPEGIGSKRFVRLACLRHTASVHPEPGSNSPKQCWIMAPVGRCFDLVESTGSFTHRLSRIAAPLGASSNLKPPRFTVSSPVADRSPASIARCAVHPAPRIMVPSRPGRDFSTWWYASACQGTRPAAPKSLLRAQEQTYRFGARHVKRWYHPPHQTPPAYGRACRAARIHARR